MTASILIDPATSAPLELMRWTRVQFEAAAAHGAFDSDRRVELLDGHILAMPVQSPQHYLAIEKASALFQPLLSSGCHVRTQAPFALSDFSAPEPDLAIVLGGLGDYAHRHPDTALLLVEVSDTTLTKDRGHKLKAYARHGVPEYWIVNLSGAQIEVHRDPQGEAYATRLLFRGDQTFTTPALPGATVKASDLLP